MLPLAIFLRRPFSQLGKRVDKRFLKLLNQLGRYLTDQSQNELLARKRLVSIDVIDSTSEILIRRVNTNTRLNLLQMIKLGH